MARIISQIVGGAQKIGSGAKKLGRKFNNYQKRHEQQIKKKMSWGWRP